MEQGIVYIVMGLVCVIAFMVGKYVMPNAQETINKALNLLSGYPLLMQWGLRPALPLQRSRRVRLPRRLTSR